MVLCKDPSFHTLNLKSVVEEQTISLFETSQITLFLLNNTSKRSLHLCPSLSTL
jgi:hypothetical protein